jgi:LDH2 family malate/lactate/ureidoglycolate dehydrogenase
MAASPAMILYSAAAIRDQATLVLSAWGMDAEDAAITADALTDADLRGIESHGVSLLTFYANWVREGRYNFAAKPQILRDGPTFALLDAQRGLGSPVSVRARNLAVTKAQCCGIAAVTVRNSRHFGAAGYYARLGARRGMMTLVASSAREVCVVPPRGAKPMLGTTPRAYGIPRATGAPIVFDIATSTAAANKVRLRAQRDMPLPEGWVIDSDGAAVTDPHKADEIVYKTGGGGLTPLGATPDLSHHKGYGLALMMQFFGGVLPGAAFPASASQSASDPNNIGHFFMAIDPAIYRDLDEFHADVEDIATTLRATPPLDPALPVLMPGESEERTFAERSEFGVPLPMALIRQLAAISQGLGLPFHLDPAGRVATGHSEGR